MKPVMHEGYTCPSCGSVETTSLEQAEQLPGGLRLSMGTGILWCVNGHLCVFDAQFDVRGKEVYNFAFGG